MSARLFLHVGSPKTGTTFLQQVLWSQRDVARGQGLLLPGRAFNDHFLACMDLRGKQETVPRSEGVWQRLLEECAEWEGDALISHELFAGVTGDTVGQAVADLAGVSDEVHVVITARDMARQLPAEWQEHLKHRSTLTFEDFATSARTGGRATTWFWLVQDVAALAARWADHVGPGRVHVVTVPPPGAGSGLLWERFATTVGLRPQEFSQEVRHANTSVGLEQAELLRRLNVELGDRLGRPGAYPVVVKDQLVHDLLALRGGTRLELREADWQLAVDHASTVTARLQELGVDVVGDLHDLEPQGELPTRTTVPEVDVERVLDECVVALAATLEAYDRTRVQLRRAREALPPPPPDPRVNPVRRGLVAASRRWPWVDRAKQVYKRRVQRPDR